MDNANTSSDPLLDEPLFCSAQSSVGTPEGPAMGSFSPLLSSELAEAVDRSHPMESPPQGVAPSSQVIENLRRQIDRLQQMAVGSVGFSRDSRNSDLPSALFSPSASTHQEREASPVSGENLSSEPGVRPEGECLYGANDSSERTGLQETHDRFPATSSVSSEARSSQRVSSGWAELDGILPGGGIRRGSLIEWFAGVNRRSSSSARCDLGDSLGQGVGLLSLRVARELCRAGGTLVILDQAGWFYPPAAAAWGVDLQRLLWLRVTSARDAFWALDQSLRCSAVRAVWCCLGTWDTQLDGRWFRRFQLAAEHTGGVGLLVRSGRYRGRPSWAELQLEVQSEVAVDAPRSLTSSMPTGSPLTAQSDRHLTHDRSSRPLRVELIQCRGPSRGLQDARQRAEPIARVPSELWTEMEDPRS